MNIERLERELLELPRADRARLAERLLASLDEEADSERMWYDEAERRLSELRSGGVREVSVEEVFRRLDRRLDDHGR